MPDIDMLTAVGEEITVAGKSYRLGVMDRTDWALVKERIMSLRADPAGVVKRIIEITGITADQAKELINRAYDDATRARIVSSRDFDAFVYSVEGQNFVFWLRMKKCQPGTSETEASRVMGQWTAEAFAGLTEKLMKMFPKMTREEVEQAQLEREDDILNRMVSKGLGMPEGNPPTPETPGTPTDP